MKHHRKFNHCPMRAFTLTELLVTIVIIITIAALSLSGFTKMRRAGDRAKAVRNISQLQLANISYAGDNNGEFVPTYVFNDTGSGYLAWVNSPKFLSYFKGEDAVYLADGKVDLTIPESMLDPVTVRAKKAGKTFYPSFGYTANGQWGQPNSKAGYKSSQLTAPERSAAFATATDWIVHHRSRFLWKDAPTEGSSNNQKMAYRYNSKALIVYYDGHVGEVSMEDIKKIDTQGGVSNIFWSADAPK